MGKTCNLQAVISVDTVHDFLHKTDIRKVTGLDCEDLLQNSHIGSKYHCTIIDTYIKPVNSCYIFPVEWKLARVSHIYTKGKKGDDPKNYRPISVMPVVAKIFKN